MTPFSSTNERHAFLWRSGSGMQDLGTLGGTSSGASAINNRGQVVGYSETVSGALHVFIYSNGQVTDLYGLIDPALGLTLHWATDINHSGQIITSGTNSHPYLLTPISAGCAGPVISDVSATPNVL
jgi:probable HAF family extracellular repeat protein